MNRQQLLFVFWLSLGYDSSMKKIIVVVIVIVLVAAGGILVYAHATEPGIYSKAQQELIDTFGPPPMFVVSYLPQSDGDDTSLVRHEVWRYPEHQQEITFLAGEIYSLDSYEPPDGELAYTTLAPGDFDFTMGYEAVAALLPDKDIVPADFVPELYDEGSVETYVTENLFFTIEHGQLTYVEAVGLSLSEEEDDQ